MSEDYEAEAPMILIPYGGGEAGYYNYYYVFKDKAPDVFFWYDAEEGAVVDESYTIPAGTAIWVWQNSGRNCTVTFAGEVISDSSVPVYTYSDAWTFFANPYPIPLSIASEKISYEGIEAVSMSEDYEAEAPSILIPYGDGEAGYYNYYYVFKDKAPDVFFWYDAEEGAIVDEDTGILPVSSGAWFWSMNDVTIRFTK